jgi:hypothetical protein
MGADRGDRDRSPCEGLIQTSVSRRFRTMEDTMRKIAMALVGGALVLTLAAPAGAAVGSPTTQSDVSRHQDRRPQDCNDGHSRNERGARGCYDERRPQHDGGGILF